MAHYKAEPELELRVMPEHVRSAKCGDPTRCTLALAGQELLGVEVRAVIEDDTAEVRATWVAPDPGNPALLRFHRSYLRTTGQALRVLMLTDQNKRKLVRSMPDEGIVLRIEEHQSREFQGRDPEGQRAESARRRKLAQDRAQGLAPPPVPRSPVARPRATTVGLRGQTKARPSGR